MDEGLPIPCARSSECSNQPDHGLEGPCVCGAGSWKPELARVCRCGKLATGGWGCLSQLLGPRGLGISQAHRKVSVWVWGDWGMRGHIGGRLNIWGPLTGGIHSVRVHARGSRNWRGSVGFEGSCTQVTVAGHSKYPGLGFGQFLGPETGPRPISGRIYSLRKRD